MGCINVLSEAMRLITSMGQVSESKISFNPNPSLEFLNDEPTACHAMICDFEKDGISPAFMIDLVGDYLNKIVARNDRSRV